MKKEYFCKQVKDEKICGKTNPIDFPKGRYTMCMECKNEYHKVISKRVYQEKKRTLEIPAIERMNQNIGKLGDNVKELFDNIIAFEPIPGVGIAIPQRFIQLEEFFKTKLQETNNLVLSLQTKLVSVENKNKELCLKNQSLESEINRLKEKIFDDNTEKISKIYL